jgi:hypothetical protein
VSAPGGQSIVHGLVEWLMTQTAACAGVEMVVETVAANANARAEAAEEESKRLAIRRVAAPPVDVALLSPGTFDVVLSI